MPTPTFNLPTINGASPISIVNDLNGLAYATDAAMGNLATQGDISAIRTLVTNANKVATEAQTEAVKASGAAEAASKAAATANATANAAKGSAANTADALVVVKADVNRIDAHAYYTDLEAHAKNPWPSGSWQGKKSNDGKQFTISGQLGVEPNGDGGYIIDKSKLTAVTVNIPGTNNIPGIPLFVLGYTPATSFGLYAGIFHATQNKSDPYSFGASWPIELTVGTDGVIYLRTQGILGNANYCYGAVSASWSI